MNLKSYTPNSRDMIITDSLCITKSGNITFPKILQEKYNITKESGIELIYDEDEQKSGHIRHVYMLVKKKDSPNTLSVNKGAEGSSTVSVNSNSFMKRIKYNHSISKRYTVEVTQISTVDYLKIDLDSPVLEEELSATSQQLASKETINKEDN